METTVFTALLLPLCLAFIMFGMGLSLVPNDFNRLLSSPKSVLLGLFGQLVLLPGIAFLLAVIFHAPTYIAIGMIILAACPGGTSSNLLSHLARANLALSISLTAITTIICVLTTPLLIKFAIDYFDNNSQLEFSLLNTSLGLIAISLIPVCLGMIMRHYQPKFALRSERLFRNLSMFFLFLIIALVIFQELQLLIDAFPKVFIYAILLNATATIVGLTVGRFGRLNKKDRTTLGIEIGTQNGTMAILIAISFIQDPALSIAPAVYSIIMYFGAGLLILYTRLSS